jgi:hypothetical protein
VADALISKIGSKNSYSSLLGLDLKYNEIRAEFSPNFEQKILKCYKLITLQRQEKRDQFTILSDSYEKSGSNSNFLDELYQAPGQNVILPPNEISSSSWSEQTNDLLVGAPGISSNQKKRISQNLSGSMQESSTDHT